MSEHRYHTPAKLDQALCDYISQQLGDAVAARSSASLVVSGGSTPKGLFQLLTKSELPWHCITVMLADERWVPTDHPDSNEKMVRELLLQGQASAATFISLVSDFPHEKQNLASVTANLEDLGTFDVVVLGMGGDMHTASLFPCSSELEEGLTTADSALMTHPTTAPHARISLSRQRLANTRHGLIHIVGDDKRAVLNSAIGRSPLEAPIAAFASRDGGFDIWFAPKN